MCKLPCVLLPLLCLFFSCLAHTKAVTIATSGHIPPYIMEGSTAGLEVDLVRDVFQESHIYNLKLLKMTNPRAVRELDKGDVNGILTSAQLGSAVYYSEPIFWFKNIAVTLASKKLVINGVADLTGKSVLAFQNARLTLGSEFSDAVAGTEYSEVYNQKAQVELLLKGLVDVIVLERRIFMHYLSLYANDLKPAMLKIHPVFTLSPRRIAFRDEALRDKFNLGLARFQQTARYEGLLRAFDGNAVQFAVIELQ